MGCSSNTFFAALDQADTQGIPLLESTSLMVLGTGWSQFLHFLLSSFILFLSGEHQRDPKSCSLVLLSSILQGI